MAEPVVALVGSDSLLGREVRDVASATPSGFALRLIADDSEQTGVLTRVGDEPALTEELTEDSLSGARVIILAGSAASSSKALDLAGDAAVIDLTGVAEENPDARVRAPQIESDEEDGGAGSVHVIAHPAAIALALFLRRLQAYEPLRRAVIQVMVPASEHGTKGVEELQQQAISLLSFKSLPQAVFDTQAGFNLLARYGMEAPVPLSETEQRIERHLATLLALPGDGEAAPMPSLRLVQAPVFHGFAFSAWVQFESNPGVDAIEQALVCQLIEVRGPDFEPPTNVSQAGQTGIAVGAIEADRNDPEACWFWLVADNIRLPADNAVELVRRLI